MFKFLSFLIQGDYSHGNQEPKDAQGILPMVPLLEPLGNPRDSLMIPSDSSRILDSSRISLGNPYIAPSLGLFSLHSASYNTGK